jgi:hypothetical protein
MRKLFQCLVSKLAQDVIAMPGSIIKFRYDNITGTDKLVKAQTELINDRRAGQSLLFPLGQPSIMLRPH